MSWSTLLYLANFRVFARPTIKVFTHFWTNHWSFSAQKRTVASLWISPDMINVWSRSCCIRASDFSCALCTFARKLLIGLVSNLVGYLIIGRLGLNNFWSHIATSCRSLSSDFSSRFSVFADNMLIWLISNFSEIIMGPSKPYKLLGTFRRIPTVSWMLIFQSVSADFQRNHRSDWS